MGFRRSLSLHRPVLLNEALELLNIKKGNIIIDGTLGSGGHAEKILECMGKHGVLLGIDQDQEALFRTQKRLREWSKQCYFEHGNFSSMEEIAQRVGIIEADGILLDLGISSDQLEDPKRGFSFIKNGVLDMRMDLERTYSAKEWIAETSVIEMARVFRIYGEEPEAKKIARIVAYERKKGAIITTEGLAKIIARAKSGKREKIHPATRVFQAIRIAVNNELKHLEKGLNSALSLLKKGGRLAVISFHSLEDRIVKHFFRAHEGHTKSLQQGGTIRIAEHPVVIRINKKPIIAQEKEVVENPRARSAKLRVLEKIEENTLCQDNV